MLEEKVKTLIKKQNMRKTLSFLRNEIKDEEKKERLRNLLTEKEILTGLLSEEDAKVRKNAALLIGDLQLEEAKEALFFAYGKETTLFVKSAYLTALGQLDTKEYLTYFKERLEKLKESPAAEEEKKHRSEEIRELIRIVIKEEGVKKHRFSGASKPCEMLLVTNKEQREATFAETKELGASVQRRVELHPLGVMVFSRDIIPFTKLRTYRELLFPIHVKEKLPQKPELAAKALWESDLFSFLTECHNGEPPFYFRLEIKGTDIKADFARKLGIALEQVSEWKLINAAGDYEIEIRLMETKDGGFVPFLKLFTLQMKRFAYRKNAVAASIHPANAAMLVFLAKPYLKANAQILDPFCGVGTMLIERDIRVPAREKYGIDIFGEAIEGARENAALAGEKINFIHRDYMDFKHDYKFDEIITNMPVRGRKTKEEQDALYAAFFEKSKSILARDGIIIMYSNEAGFVKKQLRLRTDYRLIQEYCIRKKDAYYLYIIGVKG